MIRLGFFKKLKTKQHCLVFTIDGKNVKIMLCLTNKCFIKCAALDLSFFVGLKPLGFEMDQSDFGTK